MADGDGGTFASAPSMGVQPREPRSEKNNNNKKKIPSTTGAATRRDLLARGGRREELKTKLRKAWTLLQFYSLGRGRERLRSVGAYGVLAGLFLGGRSYWATGREQRTVAPLRDWLFGPPFFFPLLNTSFCSAVFIHIRGAELGYYLPSSAVLFGITIPSTVRAYGPHRLAPTDEAACSVHC